MPELPEVETTRRGIAPHCEGRTIQQVTIRNRSLRWPIPRELDDHLAGATIRIVERRAKYLLLRVDSGTAIVHLGMSGSLRVITDNAPPLTHDHVELVLDSGIRLRFNDPRRFGCWLWSATPEQHPLLASLGPEPLAPEFTGALLFR
ncbi:MAG: DNA-formamidopyrimidine glycosylase, partial [Marinobacter sp.]|nr:DNA-formamidopyrimidine glycosylase [Marinobacter sp.]